MIYSLFIYAIFKLYLILTIYQQAHYQLRFYCKHFILNLFFYDLFPLIVLIVSLFASNPYVLGLCFAYILIFSLSYLLVRVKLVFTKRVCRLIILAFIYLVAISLIPYVGIYLLLFIEFIIVPILLLDRFIAWQLNRPYLKKAKSSLNSYQGHIVAITGSFGKTSTKLLLNQALSLFYPTTSTIKSYNTPLGIAKFVNSNIIDVYDYLILEFGASHKGDIEYLSNLAQPEVAFITGIGYMHMETFKSLEAVIAEKFKILNGVKLAVLNYDCKYIRNYNLPPSLKVITYGLSHGDFQGRNIVDQGFDLYYKEEFLSHFETKLVGKHQLLNLVGVLAYLVTIKADLPILQQGCYSFYSQKNRLELKTMNNMTILDDSFNSNYEGFVEALNTLKNLDGVRILLTPGMVELGKYKKELLNSLLTHIIASADIIILIGYFQTHYLYNLLKEYNKEVYLARNFMEGYEMYLTIVKGVSKSSLLIENDLPDLYRVGWF